MKIKALEILLSFLFIFQFIPLFAPNNIQAQETTCLYFFYGDGCPSCSQASPFIDNLKKKYPELEVIKFEIYNNRPNALLLTEFFDKHQIPDNKRVIPTVFIADQALLGGGQIRENLEYEICHHKGADCPEPTKGETQTTSEKLKALSIATVIGAAVVDSINPCAIAVLLILLTALLASGDKKKAFGAGLAFTLSIYIAYFLFGLGLFSVIKISGLSFWFYKIIGALAIVIGLFNIKDYFWYGAGGFVMEIPTKWRPRLKEMLRKVTSPGGAFLMGFVVCLFELPCTGGPYIFILGLLAEKTTQVAAIPILLLYNLFFVLPLLVLTFLIYAGFTKIEQAEKWKEKNIRRLHLVAGIVMLVLGSAVVLGLV